MKQQIEISEGAQMKRIPLDLLEENIGQLEGLPENPREITDEKYELLKKNIEEHPEFLEYNGLLVYPLPEGKFIVIGGNMRLRAMKELERDFAPCMVLPKEIPVESLRAYTILHNSDFGRWEWDRLGNDWDVESLADWGVDTSFLSIDDNFDADEFFSEHQSSSGAQKKENIITVTLSEDDIEDKEQIIQLLVLALEDYPSCKVK